jgi:hypothetical protein
MESVSTVDPNSTPSLKRKPNYKQTMEIPHCECNTFFQQIAQLKVTAHGIPKSVLAEGTKGAIFSIRKKLQVPMHHIKMLFTYNAKANPLNTESMVLAIHPQARIQIEKAKCRCRIQDKESDFVIEFADFHQPIQCKKCYTFGYIMPSQIELLKLLHFKLPHSKSLQKASLH